MEAGQSLVRVPQYPEGPSGISSAANTRILANTEYRSTVLVWCVACDGFLQVLAGNRQRAQAEPRRPEGRVGEDRECRIVGMSRQAQQRFPELSRCVQLCPYIIKPPQPIQDRDQLWRLAHLLAQLTSPGVGVLHLGRCVPFRYLQCRAEGDVQRQGLLDTLRRPWQGREQLDPGGAVADGFHMGRAVAGVLARPLPVDHRLLGTARRRVVLGDQLWLRRDGLRELRLQRLGNTLVVLLAGAPQQRLICHVLDERMLERGGFCISPRKVYSTVQRASSLMTDWSIPIEFIGDGTRKTYLMPMVS